MRRILCFVLLLTFLFLVGCDKTTAPTSTTFEIPVTVVTTTASTIAPSTIVPTTISPSTVAPSTGGPTTLTPTTSVPTTVDINSKLQEGYMNSFKVLAIGNSFSDDAFTYLYDIAKAFGVEEVIIANLYIGGCTVATHYSNAVNNTEAYTYKKCTNGTWANSKTTMLYGITDEDWDIVSLQQASGYSGVESTYNEQIDYIANYVLDNVTNENVRLAWHMTWAYQANSTHADFAKYDKNQAMMYSYICQCVKKHLDSDPLFTYIIPSGTAVQNARTSYFGDTLTQDGYHLNSYGDMIAGLTWFLTLTGASTDLIDEQSLDDTTKNHLPCYLESVKNAINKPYGVTNSKFTEDPTVEEIDLSNYDLLELQFVQGYWYATGTGYDNYISGDGTSSLYYCTNIKFTKEDIPVGSIIVLESGWQYRPEAWLTEGQQSSRQGETMEAQIIVTETWWGNYIYRSFNISKVGKPSIVGLVDEVAAAFKIYIPKK